MEKFTNRDNASKLGNSRKRTTAIRLKCCIRTGKERSNRGNSCGTGVSAACVRSLSPVAQAAYRLAKGLPPSCGNREAAIKAAHHAAGVPRGAETKHEGEDEGARRSMGRSACIVASRLLRWRAPLQHELPTKSVQPMHAPGSTVHRTNACCSKHHR